MKKQNKKYALDVECFHKYNFDKDFILIEFNIQKFNEGHKDFIISLVLFDYVIFYINFYRIREK